MPADPTARPHSGGQLTYICKTPLVLENSTPAYADVTKHIPLPQPLLTPHVTSPPGSTSTFSSGGGWMGKKQTQTSKQKKRPVLVAFPKAGVGAVRTNRRRRRQCRLCTPGTYPWSTSISYSEDCSALVSCWRWRSLAGVGVPEARESETPH